MNTVIPNLRRFQEASHLGGFLDLLRVEAADPSVDGQRDMSVFLWDHWLKT